jgi:Putative adhesin
MNMLVKERRLHWLASLAALFLVSAAGVSRPALADGTEGHFERMLKVTGAVDLDVNTGSGSITVRTGDSGTVEIRGTIRAHAWSSGDAEARVHQIESNPPIEQDGNTIRVGRMEDHDLLRNISVSYEIVVPQQTRVHSQTGSGSQTVESVAGPLEATTGSGSLRISRIGSEVRARTGSGGIEMDSVQGNIHAGTGSGSIRARSISGSVVASTGSGDVKIEQSAAGDVDVETGSGSVEVAGVKGGAKVSTGSGSITADGDPTGPWRLHTGSGSVTVRFPAGAAFELQARTSSGHIETNHPITVMGTISPREIHGKVGNGGVLVELSTSSGSIHIE